MEESQGKKAPSIRPHTLWYHALLLEGSLKRRISLDSWHFLVTRMLRPQNTFFFFLVVFNRKPWSTKKIAFNLLCWFIQQIFVECCCMPGTGKGTGDTAMSRRDSCPRETWSICKGFQAWSYVGTFHMVLSFLLFFFLPPFFFHSFSS